jgi:hypothetical protein
VRACRAAAAAFLALTLCGCIVLPAPVHRWQGPSTGSRDNVSAASAPKIVEGQTTRLDLLLALGEPDGRGEQDQWFTYRTHKARGGWHWALILAGISPPAGAVLVPVDDWERVERLTVRFDGQGIVSEVSFEGRNCSGCRNVLEPGDGASVPPH